MQAYLGQNILIVNIISISGKGSAEKKDENLNYRLEKKYIGY